MEVVHLYTKIRKDFGKHCKFSAVPATILGEVPVSDKFAKDYIFRNPTVSMFDTAPRMSEHSSNTDRLITKSSSMRHVEGGWPKDVDFTEQSDQNRFRKKAEKDEDYKSSVKTLGPIVAKCMKQNNTINIYEVILRSNMCLMCLGILMGVQWIIPVNLLAPKDWLCFVIQMISSELLLLLIGIPIRKLQQRLLLVTAY